MTTSKSRNPTCSNVCATSSVSPPWFALVLRVPQEIAEALAAELAALGRGVESRPVDRHIEELRAFFGGAPEQAAGMRAWAERRLVALGIDPDACSFVIDRVEDGRWVERYQESLQPFHVGTRFTVHPRGRIETEDGRQPLLLVPGRAFGTGEHATTQLCAEQLERFVRPGQAWLDLGCGTGILLLIARSLGATRVRGMDIDPEAVEVALGVLSLNGSVDCSEVQQGGIEMARHGEWDGVICNISTTFVRMHVAELSALPRPGGFLVVSGVLQEDLGELADRFAAAGLHEIDRDHRGPWAVLVLERPR